jgi:hypothetical protein
MNCLLFSVASLVGEPKGYSSRLLSPENLPNILLVVVAIAAIIVAVRTLKTLERQTSAIEKQGDALIDSERAWVIAELIPVCTRVDKNWYRSVAGVFTALTDREILDGDHLNHILKLTNMGRTPAHILCYDLYYSCLGSGVTKLTGVAVESQVGQRPFDHVLGAGDFISAPELIHVDKYIESAREEINQLKFTAVFHGWVKYLHVFSSTQIEFAQFQYVYKPSLFRLEKVLAPPYEKETERKS